MTANCTLLGRCASATLRLRLYVQETTISTKRIAILGSTGSIGQQTLEVIADDPTLSVCALAAGSDAATLAQQVQQFGPECVALADGRDEGPLRSALPNTTTLLTGSGAAELMVHQTKPDLVLSGVVGAAGLKPALAAIECGCTLAIANKETLVMAGSLVMPKAREAGVTVLPVDSEHSAIFQCLQSGQRSEVRRVVLSASGGALRDWNDAAVENATVAQALNHPNWSMGRKVTIDSATMMNKVLEVIEAHWLFDLSADQIDVVLHTESILHSAVEFCDGAMIAQLSEPNMTTPIAYALRYPDRPVRPTPPLDLGMLGQLNFAPLSGRFQQAIELAYEVIRLGGSAGAILNGANEAAVEAFLEDRIRFGRIVPLVERALTAAEIHQETTLEALLEADAWARRYVMEHL